VNDRRSEAPGFGRGVQIVNYERRARQDASHHLALHAFAFAVNEPHAPEARAPGFYQVLLDRPLHLAGRDSVKIKDIAYLKPNGFGKWIKGINLLIFIK
jgi:hypothetical protein